MSQSPDYDAMRGYTISRVFDAPRALVWRAISEADLFARWFGADVDLALHEWDFRPQGLWRGTMTYEGTEIPWVGKFIEIDEPSRLVLAITDEGEIDHLRAGRPGRPHRDAAQPARRRPLRRGVRGCP